MIRKLTFQLLLHRGVGGRTTPFSGLLHFTLDPYLTVLCAKQGGIKYDFWVFGMNRPGIEPRSLWPLENILLLRLMIRLKIEKILRKNQNLTIRRIIEGVRAKNFEATLIFVDFSKVFYSTYESNGSLTWLRHLFLRHIHRSLAKRVLQRESCIITIFVCTLLRLGTTNVHSHNKRKWFH